MKNHRSNLTLIERSFKLALSNIWRNRVLSVATIFVISVILFIFNIILAVNFIAQDALLDINNKVEITVYLKADTEFNKAQDILETIKQFPGVESAIYLSQKDALIELKNDHPDLSLAFEKYDLDNPLPASINIKTSHPQYHEQIGKTLAGSTYSPYLSDIISGDNQDNEIINSVSKNLVEMSNFTNQVIFWLIIIFIVGATLISLNALQVTIFTRKKEISIMKLVGASHWFIRAPFLIESIIYGFLAVMLSFFMLMIISKNIAIQDISIWSYFESINFASIFFFELLITTLISIISASLATHEYLKQDLLEN
jgi:cell division transport system permease protein